MGVNPAYAGRVYPPSPVYEVGREKIREFASAIGSADPAHHDPAAARALGHRDVVAPPTFAVIIAQQCEAQLIRDPEAGIDFSRVVHGEERFAFHRPIVAGDRLVPTLHVEQMRLAGGHGMVTTRVELAAAPAGLDEVPSIEGLEPVATVWSMLVVRGGE
ncbi:MAG: MaoC family dehydratase N-terminal domain-containing protein [Kineosporiaceae bacterium]